MGCGSSQSLLLKKNIISILNEPSCYLWKEYRSTYKNLSQSSTLKTHKLHYNNKTIEFDFTIVGRSHQRGTHYLSVFMMEKWHMAHITLVSIKK